MKKRLRSPHEENDNDDKSSSESDSLVHRDGTSIYFYADVTKTTVCRLFRCLREAATASGGGDVYVYVHSDGGDAYAGLSALDHMRAFRGATITTIADGFVASAATLILLGGACRLAMPHSHLLIHQVSGEFWGKYEELRDEMKNSTSLMRIMTSVYTKFTNMTEKKVTKLLKNEVAIDATETVKLGIVHDIEWAWME